MTLQRTLVTAVALSLTLMACGGDDADTDATAATDAAAATDAPVAATSVDPTTVPPPSAAPPASDAAVSTVGDTTAANPEAQEFCNLNRQLERDNNIDGGDPASIEAGFDAQLELIDEWLAVAPDDIEFDAAGVAEAFERLVGEVEKVEWDLSAIDGEVMQGITAEYQAESDALTTYLDENC